MIGCCFKPLLTLSRCQLTLSMFYLRFNSTGKCLKYLAKRYSYEKSKGSIEALALRDFTVTDRKVHLQYYKRSLGVNKQIQNECMYGVLCELVSLQVNLISLTLS